MLGLENQRVFNNKAAALVTAVAVLCHVLTQSQTGRCSAVICGSACVYREHGTSP